MLTQHARRHSGSFSAESNLVLLMHRYQLYTAMALRTNARLVPYQPVRRRKRCTTFMHHQFASKVGQALPPAKGFLTQRFAPLRLLAQARLQYFAARISRQRLRADNHELRDLEIGQVVLEK